ncbi:MULTISPECIES: ArsR/SmtB family transcription factor [Bacillus cereus group]|uniref:Transcriptional regulator n=1 Tax=Bacillus cereus TaxID=1396 RepID=A0AA44QAL7_BACCE|nr:MULTISPECIES: metalloregulator ArsR/SmtB family transcription factor [Bacillus cereus group]PFN05220.1 transcriptional regulator [Bacillus cereus]PFO77821.1 transcriptional regulator [Bacillus cereus]PFS00596.1 transcriptional regulator [Bacillus cereus]
MKKEFLTTTYPKANINIATSIGVNIATNILLVDYQKFSSTMTSPWIRETVPKLSQTFYETLLTLRSVFAHGAILREFIVKKIDLADSTHIEWESFISWWESLSSEEIEELITYAIIENIHYYHANLPNNKRIDQLLNDIQLDEESLSNLSTRRIALTAVLESWGITSTEEKTSFFLDANEVKRNIITLLEEFWKSAIEPVWLNCASSLQQETIKLQSISTHTCKTNDEIVFLITGLYPDSSWIEKIRSSKNIIFIPTMHMGSFLSIFEVDEVLYILFEPKSAPTQQNDESNTPLNIDEITPAVTALGDPARLTILTVLSDHQELFAQEIINKTGLHQSTVSRHLAVLESGDLLHVRKEGKTKYYSINKITIEKTITFLNHIKR